MSTFLGSGAGTSTVWKDSNLVGRDHVGAAARTVIKLLGATIRPGDTITWGQGAGEPTALTAALMELGPELMDVRLMLGMSISETVRPEHLLHFDTRLFGGYGTNRRLTRVRSAGVIPSHMSAIPQLIRDGSLPVDVVLVHVGPADRNGFHSLGTNADHVLPALDSARVVIAQVNSAVPLTHGDTSVHRSRLHHVAPVEQPMLELRRARSAADQISALIAQHVAELVPDESTIQVGVGAVPSAVARVLRERRHLGIHTGLLTDDLADLISRGAATGQAKGADPGVAVCSMVMGSRALYDFVAENPSIQVRRLDYTYAQQTLAKLQGLVAINSALEVDLTGQVNAEVANGAYVGAIGGQGDFLRGAAASPNGRAIVALPATHGSSSTIVSLLDHATVTTARSDVDFIVTEWGTAELRGRTLAERAAAMISVAHPAHQAQLRAAADRLELV